jgi:hypothetical protein
MPSVEIDGIEVPLRPLQRTGWPDPIVVYGPCRIQLANGARHHGVLSGAMFCGAMVHRMDFPGQELPLFLAQDTVKKIEPITQEELDWYVAKIKANTSPPGFDLDPDYDDI